MQHIARRETRGAAVLFLSPHVLWAAHILASVIRGWARPRVGCLTITVKELGMESMSCNWGLGPKGEGYRWSIIQEGASC